jgi:hypothetical protein
VKENQKNEQAKLQREEQFMERLRRHPELMEQLEAIVEIAEAEGKIMTADQAEDQLVEQVRKLGNQVLTDWAGKSEARIGQDFKESKSASRVRKKNL